MYIISSTSAAPSQMTADWTRNSIAESNVQRLLLGIYGIDSGPRMTFLTRQRLVYTLLQLLQHYSSEQIRGRFIRHFVRMRRVQQRHLRAILRVPYTDRITNDQILDRAGVPDIEIIVRKMQLLWAGHVARMSDDRIPKQLLFAELTTGTVGRPLLRWKDSLKDTLKQSNISTTQWQDTATDRSTWRRSVHDGLMLYDNSRRERNATKRARRHAARNATSTASQDANICRHCGRICSSRIGILSHERACNKQRGRDT